MRTLEQPHGSRAGRRFPHRERLGDRSICLLFLWLCLSASCPTGSAASIDPVGVPGYHQVLLNEIQSRTSAVVVGQNFSTEPWVELFNPGSRPLSLDGFALSDNYQRLRKWRFPSWASIPAGGYLVVWMDGRPSLTSSNELHVNFPLDPKGGSLVLSSLVPGGPPHPVVIDYLDYPAIPLDLSYGVVPSAATLQRHLLTRPTPGAANIFVPTLIINEWFVAPANEAGWFELYNPSTESVPLTGLVLTIFNAAGQQSNPFVIPKGRKLEGGGFLRVWADNRPELNLTDTRALHVPFILPTVTFTLQLATTSGLLISQVVTKVPNPQLPEARYPDGARFIDTVNIATPGAPNLGRPRFVSPPESKRIRVGESLTWNGLAEGSAPLTYQWYKNEKAIAGATDPVFKISSAAATDAGSYMVRAFNPAGTTTVSASLDVLELPRVVIDAPAILSVPLGKSFRLPAGIGGTGPFQIQWKRNGINILQANQTSYAKDLITLEDGGSYTAAVVNDAGVVLSTPIRVVVDVPASKVADQFAERIDLGLAAQGSLRGSNRNATKEPGEPLHAGNRGGRSVWFSWTPSKSGIATFDTKGSTFDTLLAIYTGNEVQSLKRVESDDDRGGFYTSLLKFNATAKTTYAIAIDGYGGDTNDFILSWTLDSTTLQLPVIVRHPDSLTAVPGSSASFRVVASANASAFQWLFNGRTIRGATKDTLTLAKVDTSDIGLYSVLVASTDKQVVESYPARLELGDLPRDPSEDKYDPPFQPFSLPSLLDAGSLELAGTPTVSVGAGTIGTQWLTTSASFTQASEPPPCGAVGGSSRYQIFVLSSEADMIIDTVGSTYNTILTVYSLGKAPPFKYVACDKNGSSSTVQFTGTPGTAYYAFVDSADGTTGLTQLNWRCGSVPKLLSPNPPVAKSIESGELLNLNTSIAAVPPLLSYQWMLDGAPASGGTPTLWSVPSAGPDDTGTYALVLSNAMGSVTGLVGTVAVQVPFELSAELQKRNGATDVLIQGMAEQGFIVEASQDLIGWCYFAVNGAPSSPFSYSITNAQRYPRLFFRCQPWPITPPYEPVLCAPGFP